MNNQQEMKQVSIAEIIKEHNLVVPEIQREYVWGRNDYNILDTFLEDIKNGYNAKNIESPEVSTLEKLLDTSSPEQKTLLYSLLHKLRDSSAYQMNIGFLYSYKPNYYISDEGKDAYLIDGQQRFTTLFLILFYLAIKEDKQLEFKELFRINVKENKIAFDYRVRAITHNFIIDMITHTKTIKQLLDLTNKSWFLSTYKNDTTITGIVGKHQTKGALEIIHDHLKDVSVGMYDFARNNIKFWHFKTEETSQGEELYITMNSRGQQLADNETIRAILFKSETAKKDTLKWSQLWEEWQDFFWKNKRDDGEKNKTADDGFNEFLRWIQIMKMVELQEVIVDDENEEAPDKKNILKVIKWSKWMKLDPNYLFLEDIDFYFKALKYLFEGLKLDINETAKKYNLYTRFALINQNWLCPSEKDKNIGQIEAFKLLPALYYCKQLISNNLDINPDYLFRLIRFLYNVSKDSNINKSPGIQLINMLKVINRLGNRLDISDIVTFNDISSTLLNAEERNKFIIFRSSNERFSVEDLLWRAEDNKLNNGQIHHLLDITYSLHADKKFDNQIFERILNTFEELTNRKNYIWGNLVNTDVYKENYDRIYYLTEWYKTKDFLSIISDRYNAPTASLRDFFHNRQKLFVQNYKTIEDILKETSFKNQVYLYYIMHTKIIKKAPEWTWNYGYNFGAWQHYKKYKSFFTDEFIFQQYDRSWRENEIKILHIHNSNKGTEILENLIEWSKN